MKRIKENQMGAWCKFCPPKTTRAVWRSSGMGLSSHACEEHRTALKAEEDKRHEADSRMTKADYQTWGRL